MIDQIDFSEFYQRDDSENEDNVKEDPEIQIELLEEMARLDSDNSVELSQDRVLEVQSNHSENREVQLRAQIEQNQRLRISTVNQDQNLSDSYYVFN